MIVSAIPSHPCSQTKRTNRIHLIRYHGVGLFSRESGIGLRQLHSQTEGCQLGSAARGITLAWMAEAEIPCRIEFYGSGDW